jgi:sugar lactone lactonase YvrE
VAALEVLIDGIDFGEGPRWHDGRLWYSDFLKHAVFTVTVDGHREIEVEIDDQPSGLGWLPDGRLLLVSMHDQKVLRREADGTVVEHADLSGVATGPCNDMVVAADGTAYVGNFGFEVFGAGPAREAALARVTPGGEVDVAAEGLRFPNGSVITPDGRTLIVGESFGRRYVAFAIGPDGALSGRRTWAEVPDRSPDGCTLDAEGAIWFANAAGTTVARVREGGEITHEIEIGQSTYACALGGDDGRTLFVVSADRAPMPEAAGSGTGKIRTVRVDVPHAGLP